MFDLAELYEALPEACQREPYTEQAFRMLPVLPRFRILDIGCGRGVPALQLAGLSDGHVDGVDVDPGSLAAFAQKIRAAGQAGRVAPVRCAMDRIGLCDGRFDVVWSEGAVLFMGLERGLAGWRRLLRPGGFLVIHEAAWLRPDPPPEVYVYWSTLQPGIATVPEYLQVIQALGYQVIGHFALPEEAWWRAYFAPLQARVEALRRKYPKDPGAHAALDRAQDRDRHLQAVAGLVRLGVHRHAEG